MEVNMKLTKRIWALMLCVCMLTALIVMPANAEPQAESNVSMTVDKNEVKVGDTITVVLTNKDIDVQGFGTWLEFDKSLVECTSVLGSYGDEYLGLDKPSGRVTWVDAIFDDVANTNSDGRFSFGVVPGADTQFVESDFATLTFTAIAEGTVTFVLNEDTAGASEFKGIAAEADVVITAEPAPMGFAGYQFGTGAIRFIGYTDSLEYDSIDLVITSETGKVYSKATQSVYKTLKGTVDGETVNVATCDPAVDALVKLDYGYLYGYAIERIPEGEHTFTIVPTAKIGEETVTFTAYTLNVTVASDGTVNVVAG